MLQRHRFRLIVHGDVKQGAPRGEEHHKGSDDEKPWATA
jgi:hypothetical protein